MTKNFKNMSLKQLQQFAEKNRISSKTCADEEYEKRGITKGKQKKREVYVDRSEDPKIKSTDHRTLFTAMKKAPFS